MNDVKAKVRQFILSTLPPGKPAPELGDETPLRTSGLLDSLALLGLISFIETEFKIELSASELTPESFNSIAGIAALVARKQK